jgi:hypothetical protein
VPGDFLRGRMALLWTGCEHVTYENTNKARDYALIEKAGTLARAAALPGQAPHDSLAQLAAAVDASYAVQLGEGMAPLPEHGQLARKYCGGGWGGYALYLCAGQQQRDALVKAVEGSVAVEPYIHS